jgi:hypothetical protein
MVYLSKYGKPVKQPVIEHYYHLITRLKFQNNIFPTVKFQQYIKQYNDSYICLLQNNG